MVERLAVFLDYQNVHLVAHGLFQPFGAPVHASVVHPVAIAERIVAKRAIDSELAYVRVFRGRPNPTHHPVPTAAFDAQRAAWERDPRCTIVARDLNYRGWPDQPPREKGVDVALAISLVESALLGEYDAAVVFSGDTDLVPAIEMAFRRTRPRIEIAAWTGSKPLWFPDELAATPRRYLPYCHFFDEGDFRAVVDTTNYLSGR